MYTVTTWGCCDYKKNLDLQQNVLNTPFKIVQFAVYHAIANHTVCLQFTTHALGLVGLLFFTSPLVPVSNGEVGFVIFSFR
jgi:hypothetical protein